jgi:hypothetical protein
MAAGAKFPLFLRPFDTRLLVFLIFACSSRIVRFSSPKPRYKLF